MSLQQTSLDAYFEVTRTLGERHLQVLNCLNELKEATNLMIAQSLSLPINSITPRVFELRQRGLVVESYRDTCPISKRKAIFWRIRHG